MTLANPEKIGKYEILDKIGEGGFGVVYKGRDPFIKRLVAVKTCSSEDETIRKRFFREAEIAGNLHHANVVTLHDFGVEGHTPYLVQEYLSGEDLDVIISTAPRSLTPEVKLRILRGIAEGLHYAHGHDVIHRDIKPGNVRVLEDGRIKVMDFGIAKLRDQDSQLTQTGMTLGTVSYLSPEQLKGETLDHRADIFSYGVLAYELLTGTRPFQADTISTLFYKLLHEEPTPIDDGSLPAGLSNLVGRCLAKEPDQRFADFGEVISALDEIQAALPGSFEDFDPFLPRSPAAGSTTAHGLVSRAQQALDRRDLTAVEMTLKIARRQVDGATFEREFGRLVRELEKLKHSLAGATETAEVPPVAELSSSERMSLEAAVLEIEQRIASLDFDAAAISLTALEQRYPGREELEPARRLLTQMARAQQEEQDRQKRQERGGAASGARARRAAPPRHARPLKVSTSAETPPHPFSPPAVASPGGPRLSRRLIVVLAALTGVVLLTVWWLIANRNGGAEAGGSSVETIDLPGTETLPPGGATEDLTDEGSASEAAEPEEAAEADPAAQPAQTAPAPSRTAQAPAAGTTPPASSRAAPSREPGSAAAGSSASPPSGTAPATAGGEAQSATPPAAPQGPAPSASPPAGARSSDAAPQPPALSPQARQARRRRAIGAIRETLIAYQAAWRALDEVAVNALHPSAGLSRHDMERYTASDIVFEQCSPTLEPRLATLQCEKLVHALTGVDGETEMRHYQGVRLRRVGDRWRIASLF